MACETGQLTIVLNICQKGQGGGGGGSCADGASGVFGALSAAASGKDITDPNCDPNNPRIVTIGEVDTAYEVIKQKMVKTPCTRSRYSDKVDFEIYFKKDFMLYTGNFKERGACYALHVLNQKGIKGAVSASAGNHAFAMAYHGKLLGIAITVVMPVTSPMVKIRNCKELGANVIVMGNNMAEAKKIGLAYAQENGLEYINGFDHPDIVAGAGCCAKEVLEDVPDADVIVCPIGGGGLLAGCCVVMKSLPTKRAVIGAETDKCPAFTNARKEGKPTFTEAEPTIAEGLAVPVVGYNSFATANPIVDDVVVVEEKWVAKAMLYLVEYEKGVVEGAGATGFAALLKGYLDKYKGKKVVIVLTGGNIDIPVLGRCLDRALAAEGRLIKITAQLTDRAFGLPDMLELTKEAGVNVVEIHQERPWVQDTMWSYEVSMLCETVDMEMTNNLLEKLTDKYGNNYCVEPIPKLEPGS